MSHVTDRFWFDYLRSIGMDVPLPTEDEDEAWAEYCAARVARADDAPAERAPEASVELASLYGELRLRAERFMRGQRRDHTLQTTALVNEACLRLFGQQRLEGCDRAHLLALASTAMRSVLVDHARARNRIKRQPPGERDVGEEIRCAFEANAIDVLALDEALARLARFDPLMARAVELCFFGGLSRKDAALALDVPLRTLERRWAATRAWLKAEIE